MGKFLFKAKRKIICAAMLFAALVPFQTAHSQVIKGPGSAASCMIILDLLAQRAPADMTEFVKTYMNTSIPNYGNHLQDAYAAIGGKDGFMFPIIEQRISSSEEMGLLWFEVFDCTRELDMIGLIRGKVNPG